MDVDFKKQNDSITNNNYKNSDSTINVAVSAMISPKETFKYYREIFDYLSKKINRKIILKQRKTYGEVNQMLENGQVDLAFICSGAYVNEDDKKNIDLLLVPLCNNKPYYQAYVIVNKNSGINHFGDLYCKSFAFTDPLSNTGCLYAKKLLKDNKVTGEGFFSKLVYTYAHDASIQLVQKNIIDGATIDGLIFEYLKTYYPDRVSNIRILEKSELFGIPPIVTSKYINSDIKNKIKNELLLMHNDSVGIQILKKLLINKFELGNDSNYNSIRKFKKIIN
ncbi:MAG: hypothetical protein A2046_15365 [Bacteroidetes bacterium GWA2_30_7]|nr:MAG: hypothetical protein A2046_15365 [Bacteroidetes bacterium GWA2_30_7]